MSQRNQVHKRIVLVFMKEVLENYDQKRISLVEALSQLKLSKSQFCRHLKTYRQNPSEFGISYSRTSVNHKLSVESDKKIAKILRDEKELIRDPNVRSGNTIFQLFQMN